MSSTEPHTTVLVAGAAGSLGHRIAAALAMKPNVTVKALVRPASATTSDERDLRVAGLSKMGVELVIMNWDIGIRSIVAVMCLATEQILSSAEQGKPMQLFAAHDKHQCTLLMHASACCSSFRIPKIISGSLSMNVACRGLRLKQGSHISIAPDHVQVTGDVNHTHSLPKAVQGVDVVVSALQVSSTRCSL